MKSSRNNEPWARDELQYNRKFFMMSDYHGNYDLDERSEHEPGRLARHELRRIDYFGRWNNKFVEQVTLAQDIIRNVTNGKEIISMDVGRFIHSTMFCKFEL